MEQKEMTITEYIIAQLEQPVLTTQLDENGRKVKRNATDPRYLDEYMNIKKKQINNYGKQD